jgi:hypothetical protein
MLPRPLTVACLLSTLCVGSVAAQSTGAVIVVATNGSGDVTTVEAGLDLAAPGDTLLLREGSYVPVAAGLPDDFLIVAKSLTIVGDGAGATVSRMRITGQDIGEEVVLRNLTIEPPILSGGFGEILEIVDCAGTVALEDCTLLGMPGVSIGLGTEPFPGYPALVVSNCSGVTLTRCTLEGGEGLGSFGPLRLGISAGGPAAITTDSELSLFHCDLVGGDGGFDGVFGFGSAPGGSGIVSDQSKLFVVGGVLTGGNGSAGGSAGAPETAAGGDGVTQTGAASWSRLLGSTVSGGEGGLLDDGSSGPDGSAVQAIQGLAQTFPVEARSTSAPATAREGESVTLGVSGPPGELGKILIGFDLLAFQLGGQKGVSMLGGPVVGPVVLGTIPASGSLELNLPIAPGSLLGFDGLRVDTQGFTFGVEGFRLGNATHTVVLDPGL